MNKDILSQEEIDKLLSSTETSGPFSSKSNFEISLEIASYLPREQFGDFLCLVKSLDEPLYRRIPKRQVNLSLLEELSDHSLGNLFFSLDSKLIACGICSLKDDFKVRVLNNISKIKRVEIEGWFAQRNLITEDMMASAREKIIDMVLNYLKSRVELGASEEKRSPDL